MNILLIGGTNFIGPVLARELIQIGHRVILFHRSKGNNTEECLHIQGDCGNVPDLQRAIQKAKPDVIIHMVAYFQSHITALEQALDGQVTRTIIVSSCDVYQGYEVLTKLSDLPPVPVPFTEDAPLRDVLYPYRDKLDFEIAHDYDKILVEQAALQSFLLNAVILRLGMVYGEHDPNRRFFDPIQKMESGAKLIELDKNMADFRACKSYVGNIAHGIALAITKGQVGEIYNLADQWVLTEWEWLQLLAKKLNWSGDIIGVDKEIAGMNVKQDFILVTDKIRKSLGYKEPYSLDDALSNTIAWELNNQ